MFLDQPADRPYPARVANDAARRALWVGLTALMALAMTACHEDQSAAPDPAPMAEPEPDPTPETPQGIVPSNKARVKFKGGERYARDLSAALDIRRDQMCNELGLYDCVSVAHRIALGGVEPYELGIDEPLPVAPVSAAMAVDRVALSACIRRVEADFAEPGDAVIFGALADGDGPERGDLEAVSADLVDRILRRDATPEEIATLADFYADAEAGSDDPPRAFAQLSCFAVATMLEALFY